MIQPPTKHNLHWNFFFRTESSRRKPSDGDTFYVNWPFPAGTSLAYAMDWMRSNGKLGRGSHRAGCYEVQTPEGIWQHVDEKRIDLSTPAKASKVRFRTWEELDAASELELD